MNCVWLIIAELGSRIHLIFSDFEVESQFDYLIVKDEGMPEPTTFGTFSGKDVPSQIASNGHIMRLEFQSDHSNTARGFNITYTSKAILNNYSSNPIIASGFILEMPCILIHYKQVMKTDCDPAV